ncbi:MAG: 4'-phosphopantetheinyl transferase superfamily protein [Anaeromyxobacter sp.]
MRPLPPSSSALAGAATLLRAVAGADVWRIDLDAEVEGAASLLDEAERVRAARFVFERDRRRFVTGRAALRTVLAACAGVSAAGLSFHHGPHGKPSLPGGPPFSFSHSQGCGLLAVGGGRELGVDVERIRTVPEAAEIARSVFDAAEQAAWAAAGGDAGAGFLRLWTRKEAALKAMGVGLGGLDGGIDPRRTVEVLDLELDADHVAALAWLRG